MCVMAALPILSMGLGIAQAGAGYSAAVDQANQQNAYWQSNFNAAIKAQDDRYAAIGNQLQNEKHAASADLFNKRIEGIRAAATARTAAGESGVTGLSTNALLDDYAARLGRQEDAVGINYQIKLDNAGDELRAANAQTISRINSVQRAGKVSKTPFVFQALGGVVGGLQQMAQAG